MAEVILSPLLDVIKRNLAPAAIEELRLVWGLEKELMNLKSTLSTIQAVLEDAEDMQSESKAVKDWLEKLQDVAYDAEDLVDDMAVEAQQSMMESETGSGLMKMMQQVCNFLPSCFSCSTQVDSRWEMAHRIKDINEQLNKIADEKEKLHLQAWCSRKQSEIREGQRQLVSSVTDESQIFGRQKEKYRIIESLLSDDSSNRRKFSVIAITGMGGQGKTTLAQLVYNDQTVISKFEIRAWVCVSEDFDVIRLTKEIIESASGSSCGLSSIDALQRRLLQIFNGKKFLLVLDDVWNENFSYWDQLQGPFAFGEKGSQIVVTTRSQAVSSVMQPKFTCNLEGLSKEDCWALFRSRAFPDDDEEHVNADYPCLVKIGRKLVDKCQGLPLAAKALGGLLSSTRDEKEWENVLKSKTWELHGAGGEILPALRLSYQHLPAHLKRCFTFCSVYPKDHWLEQQELVQMWIAHDFVRGKDEEQIEDTGSRYFNDLVRSSFFQFSKYGYSYVIHDLFHDLAQSIASSECFNASDSKQRQDIPKKARHLWLNTYSISPVNVERIYELRGLRTLFVRGNLKWTNELFNSLKFLRVLKLEGCDMPDSIGNLRHLRYLKFENHAIKELPESICSICNLQTLILNCDALVKLPNGTSNLSNLRHLQLDYCASLDSTPPGIGRLTCLQMLSVFVVGREEKRGIEELKNLTDLRGSLEVRNLEHVQNAEAAQQANLRSKSYINDLTLLWSNRQAVSSIDERLEEEVAEGLQPHPNVKKLYFYGYMGTRFPHWMMKSGMDMLLPNLTHLKLYRCRRCSILPPLGQLPSLVELDIGDMDELKDWFGADEDEFRNLHKLYVNACPKLTKWPIKLPALSELRVDFSGFDSVPLIPSLRSLYIHKCSQLTSLSCLPSLEQLYLSNLDNLDDWLGADEDEFGNLRELQVQFCPKLTKWPTKLSALSELRVSNCSGFDSVPLIPSIRSLTIDNCSQLTSLPCLPSLEQLYLSNLDNLDDWLGADEDEFGNLRELKVKFCPKLTKWPTKLSALSNLKVSNCSGFDSVPLIPSIRSLRINNCSQLTCLPCLPSLEQLYLSNLGNLDDWLGADEDEFGNLRGLEVKFCPKLKKWPTKLSALSKLEVSDCSGFDSVPLVPSLRILHIHMCSQLTSLSCLPSLDQLRLFDLDNLDDRLGADEDGFRNLRELEVNNCPKLTKWPTKLSALSKLRVSYCSGFDSVPLIPSVHSLSINNCSQLTSLPYLPSLEHLYLSNLDNLDDWLGADEDDFGNLRELQVQFCPKLTKWPTKLSALSKLTVSNCSGFDSVPLIPSIRNLTIHNCSQLTCLPCLPSLEQLYLSNLDNLDDWLGANEDEFGNLRELEVQFCPKLTKWPTKLSALSNLKVSNCSGFDSVPLIPSIRSLRIHNCSQLTCLPCLPSLEQLYLSNLDNLDDWLGADEDEFGNLRELEVQFCPKLTKWPTKLSALSKLEVSDCSGFDLVPLIPSIRSLIIHNCSQLTCLPCLPSLEQLYLSNLDNLDDWLGADEDEFGNLRELEVKFCPKLTKWPTKLSALSKLQVSNCSGFDSVPLIPSLRTLSIGRSNENLLNSVSSLTSLSSLTLCDLKLIAMPGGILKALTQLECLDIFRCEQLETFLDMDDVPPNLNLLGFDSCGDLKSLPKGLHALTSLQQLEICACRQVQALPEEGLPTGLQKLYIYGCPTLEERCRKDVGEDWPKISHIPLLIVYTN